MSGADDDKPRMFDMDTLAAGAELRDVLSSLFGEDAELAGATTLGRYQILRKIGSGGMGAVYEAFDPNLDRRIAIKVLHSDAPSEERLIAEGKAMAKLNHPNVVTVHDVDAVDGQVFVAMEYVHGVTLRQWQDERPRSWREVLEMYLAFGEGIAAAHQSGLVHCDLKPENVLVGDDGRPRVTDFGIAKLRDAAAEPVSLPTDGDAAPLPGTRASAVMGTPHYMSPEQFLGRTLDDRADQFGFCVMLWEALFRVRPFDGGTLLELAANIWVGPIAAPPRGRTVPRWLRQVCERGLEKSPDARWPSFRALLDELSRGRARARRRVVLATTAAVGLGVAVAVVTQQALRAQAIAACDDQGQSIREVWGNDQASQVTAALLGTGLSYAAFTADTIRPWLDAQADAWADARAQACSLHEVEKAWDDETYARAQWCLDDRRLALQSSVEALRAPSKETVTNAVMLVSRPNDVAACIDDTRLQFSELPASESREAVRAVLGNLARASASTAAGRYADAKPVAEEALAAARTLDWPPLTAAALHAVAISAERSGDYDEAHARLVDAYFEATRHLAPELGLTAALRLVYVEGELRRNGDAALLWAEHAKTLLDRLGAAEHESGSVYHLYLGHTYRHRNALDEAETEYRAALRIVEELYGPTHPNVDRTWSSLGALARARGRYDEATEIARRTLERGIDRFGPDHPAVAKLHMDLATALGTAGQATEALPHAEKSLRIREAAEGATTPRVAGDLITVGGLYETIGNKEKAREANERAVAILEQTVGPDHPRIAVALNNLANVHRSDDDFAAAKPLLLRALEIMEKSNASRYQIAVVLYNLGEVLDAVGERVEARRALERSLSLRETDFGPKHARLVPPLIALTNLAEQPQDAVALAERAVAIARADGRNPRDYGRAAPRPRGASVAAEQGPGARSRGRTQRTRCAARGRGGRLGPGGRARSMARSEGLARLPHHTCSCRCSPGRTVGAETARAECPCFRAASRQPRLALVLKVPADGSIPCFAMRKPPKLDNECARIAELHALGLLDTASEERFDRYNSPRSPRVWRSHRVGEPRRRGAAVVQVSTGPRGHGDVQGHLVLWPRHCRQ